MRTLALGAAVLGLFLAGCGSKNVPPEAGSSVPAATETLGEGEIPTEPGSGGTGTAPAGAKISVKDAIDLQLVGELLVEGYAIYEGGNYLLCETVQNGACGQPSILMQGYDGNFSTERKVVVPGELDGDILRVSD